MKFSQAVATMIQSAKNSKKYGTSRNRFAIVEGGRDYSVIEFQPGESLLEGGEVIWSIFGSDSLAEIHAFYREVNLPELAASEWVSIKEAATALRSTKQAVNLRLQEGRWPLGHAKAVTIAMQPRPVWMVSRSSVEAVASGVWDEGACVEDDTVS